MRREEIVSLLRAEGEEAAALFRAADAVRTEYLGNAVHLRAVIEFSNYCVKTAFTAASGAATAVLPATG